ncbi:hypothetical protein [Sulfurimonas indica]|uniref:hypothetical protein n=1 Tax=Sulfurimonas TaxID=202746 RepID=UPI001264D639|nr:hypothetical protein [Sulfurimonas indica]
MKIYFACPTGQRRDNIVKDYGDKFGACLTRDIFNNVTAKQMPWFFDNGAFSDWKTKKLFDFEKFTKRLLEIEGKVRFKILPDPDFVVIPDIVTKGNRSLVYSNAWMEYLNHNFPYFKYYLAVQDGMSIEDVENYIRERMYDGLFLGGTKSWKYENGEKWVQLAHKYGLPIHCGGVGTRKNILWAKMAGFDSCDSGVAMIHPMHLNDVLNMDRELLWSA